MEVDDKLQDTANLTPNKMEVKAGCLSGNKSGIQKTSFWKEVIFIF
jgi:hypothetical protein